MRRARRRCVFKHEIFISQNLRCANNLQTILCCVMLENQQNGEHAERVFFLVQRARKGVNRQRCEIMRIDRWARA